MSVAPEVNVNELLNLARTKDLGQSEIVRQKCKDARQHLARAMQAVLKAPERRQNWPPGIFHIYDGVIETSTDAFARFDMIDELRATQKQKNHLSVTLIMFIEVSVLALKIIDSSAILELYEEFYDKLKRLLTEIELRMAKIQAEAEQLENNGEEMEDQNRSPTAEMEEC
uniref:Uncharacterized protein n=1 Tax=Trichuris muris TaxID=70415 RepID=A0A5S6Q6I5_TRIMR